MAKRHCAKRSCEPDESYIAAFVLALAHYARGDRSAADAALADLIATGPRSLDLSDCAGLRLRGETDKAFEWLQIALR